MTYRLHLPVNYSSPSVSHIHFIYLSSGLWQLVPWPVLPTMHLPVPWMSRGPRWTPSAACWTHGIGGASPVPGRLGGVWFRRAVLGSGQGMSWIVLSFGTSTGIVPTAPRR